MLVSVITGAKISRTGIVGKNGVFHARIYLMKDMILEIKRKAVALNIDSSLEELENQLIDLKQQIKVLDTYLDLKMVKD